MVQYAEISGHDFVFENSTRWYVDALTVVRYDDNGSLQTKHYHQLSTLADLAATKKSAALERLEVAA